MRVLHFYVFLCETSKYQKTFIICIQIIHENGNFENEQMNKVSKGERLLATLAKTPLCELTEAGANYIRQRFDPYHDRPVKAVGLPDNYNGHTVSRIIKKSLPFTAISAEGSVPAAPWNCSIFQTPICDPQVCRPVTTAVSNRFEWDTASTATGAYGGLMIVRHDTDDVLLPPVAGSTNLLGILSLTSEDLSNVMRVTAMGFEFIDSTSVLNRQGVLTAYRQNEQQQAQSLMEGVGRPVVSNIGYEVKASAKIIKKPPKNVNDAMNIPDTKQWKVEEGAYCSIDFNQDDIPMTNPVPVMFMLQAYNADMAPGTSGNGITHFSFEADNPIETPMPTSSPTFTRREYVTPAQKYLPINQSGIILSGLNPLFSGVVNCIWYVECAPSGEDVELLTLASQSPAYDPFAMKLIGILRFLEPICVKLRENYTGEWFFNGIRDAIKKISPWLTNAQVVGNQVVKWIDNAGTNDGMINPQSFVKGNVATKIASEKKQKKALKGNAVPKAPGPAPNKRAFRPQAVRTKAFGSNIKQNSKAFKKKSRSNNWIAIEDRVRAHQAAQNYLDDQVKKLYREQNRRNNRPPAKNRRPLQRRRVV